jgi:hypothetical protein
MRQSSKAIRQIAGWGLLIATIALVGCASPIEIKTAARAEVNLINALDEAVVNLQTGLTHFHEAQAARIREEGRVLIAQQAIDAAFPFTHEQPVKVTADKLFEKHKAAVQPWIDYAFRAPDFDASIERLEKRKEKITDPLLKAAIEKQLQDLKVQKMDATAGKPKPVQDIEKIVLDDLAAEEIAAKRVDDLLDILRAQIAVMKNMAEKVDAWLAIDVTMTPEQADALKASLSAATKALQGGGKP